MYLIPIPAFSDNYLWLLHNGKRALIVDPGDAGPVQRVLQENGLELESILVTHHHPDHTGGVAELHAATGAPVYGPSRESIPEPFTRLLDGDTVQTLGLGFQVIDVPGHTSGHIAFYCADPTLAASRDAAPDQARVDRRPLLFCGDTLFSGGCGRLFEGTPAQMLASLDRLSMLPASTRVCCAHEYTLSNLRFALAVEPDNAELIGYHARCVALRDKGLPTVPTSIAQELLINPFLRTRQATVMAAARHFDPAAHDDNTVFAAIRQWKNQYK